MSARSSSGEAAIRRRVERYGLRVICSGCGARGRHRSSIDGRLRRRPCPKCGGRLRAVWWAVRYPAAFAREAREERELRSATRAWEE
jgi:rRNA maturation protein Nop10